VVVIRGGKVLIVDGNMGKDTWVKGLQKVLMKLTAKAPPSHMKPEMMARHQAIRSRAQFSEQMPAICATKPLA